MKEAAYERFLVSGFLHVLKMLKCDFVIIEIP